MMRIVRGMLDFALSAERALDVPMEQSKALRLMSLDENEIC